MKTSIYKYSGQSTLADAKARLNIHALWRHFGFDGQPGNSCRTPWREDRKPSLSITTDGALWHDFATGEGGDAVDFFQRATGLPQKAACRKFIELAGGHPLASLPAARHPKRPAEPKPRPVYPNFRKGEPEDFIHLGRLRQIPCQGLQWASERGLLWFATLKDLPAWIITDASRLNAQARRMDGRQWDHIAAKAYTLPGSWASWPVGIAEAKNFPAVALVEGGPDLLAAHYLTCQEQSGGNKHQKAACAPVAMLGAGLYIHPDALPLFSGKRVRIFGHDDSAGRLAVRRWANQLDSVGAEVDAFTFAGLRQADGQPAGDLNEALKMDEQSLAKIGDMLP